MPAYLYIIPYFIIYPFMDFSKVGSLGFYPTVNGDIMLNYPTKLLHFGYFAYILYLYGTNSNKGTDNVPNNNIINTDFNLYAFLLNLTSFNFPPFIVRKIMHLYSENLTVSIPLNTSTERFAAHGY